MEEWFQLVISCYPLSATGGAELFKLERNISHDERTLLLDLFRKQRHGGGIANQLPVVQVLLSQLMVISVGYCWKEFNEDDWSFVFSNLSSWIQSAVVIMEEAAENVNDAIADSSSSNNLDDIIEKLEKIVFISDPSPINNARNAILSFSLCHNILLCHGAEDSDNSNPLRTERWDRVRNRIAEGILRLFFCTGICEAIASSYGLESALVIASSRLDHFCFWELVASSVVNSSPHVKDRAVKSVEFWGLRKGPISALYAILFSSKPIAPLQYAAFVVLSADPVSQLAIFREDSVSSLGADSGVDQDMNCLDLSSENVYLQGEISCMIEKLPFQVVEMDLTAQERVNLVLPQ